MGYICISLQMRSLRYEISIRDLIFNLNILETPWLDMSFTFVN